MQKIQQIKQKIIDFFKRKKKKPGQKKKCVSCKGKGNGKNQKKGPSGKSRKRLVPCGNCFTPIMPVWRGDGRLEAIGKLKLGQRVDTWHPNEPGYETLLQTPNMGVVPETHRAIWFMQEWEDGYQVKVGMLRSLEWLEEAGITEVGDVVEMDLEEMGVEGDFQVMAIDPCPPIEEGSGRLVIGVYEFNRGDVHELKLQGIEQPIEVTPGHPFWSPDRGEGGDWVPAGELQVGQQVLVKGGCAVVEGWKRKGDEGVCNIEVEGAHCYRVGAHGVLVHNASTDPMQIEATHSSTSVGYRYAIAAWAYRRRRTLVEGSHKWGRNYGYLTFINTAEPGRPTYVLGAGPAPKPIALLNSITPQAGYGPGTDTHSEQQLRDTFQNLKVSKKTAPKTLLLLLIFSVNGLLALPASQPWEIS
jgi:hypothetical protein